MSEHGSDPLGEDALSERIAGDLHDGLVQWLVGAKMQAEAIRMHHRSGRAISSQSLDSLIDSLANALVDARRLLKGLHGPDVAGGMWHEALRGDLSRTGEMIGLATRAGAGSDAVRAHVEIDLAPDTEPLPEATAATAYRLLREAVWNSLRHAAADTIHVTARRVDDRLLLTVADDGRGFDPDHVPENRLGVRGMMRRAERAGGAVDLRTAPGHGTRYEIRLPLDPQSAS